MTERHSEPDLFIAHAGTREGFREPTVVPISPTIWRQLQISLRNRGTEDANGDWIPETNLTVDEFDDIAGRLEHTNGDKVTETEKLAMFEGLQYMGMVSPDEQGGEGNYHISVGNPFKPKAEKTPGYIRETTWTRAERKENKRNRRLESISNGVDQFIEDYPIGWSMNTAKVVRNIAKAPFNGKHERRAERKVREELGALAAKAATWNETRLTRMILQADPDEMAALAQSRSDYIRMQQGHGGGHVVRRAHEPGSIAEDTHPYIHADVLSSLDTKYHSLFENATMIRIASEVKVLAAEKEAAGMESDQAIAEAENEVFAREVENYEDAPPALKIALSAGRAEAYRRMSAGNSRPPRTSGRDGGGRSRGPRDRDDDRGPRGGRSGGDRRGSLTPDDPDGSGSTTDSDGGDSGSRGSTRRPTPAGTGRPTRARSGGGDRSGGPRPARTDGGRSGSTRGGSRGGRGSSGDPGRSAGPGDSAGSSS